MGRPLEEYLSRTRKFVILERGFHVPSTSVHHGERYFFTLLHCFIMRKTSMNAVAPADYCVSTTVQLVMYTHWVDDVPRVKVTTQLNSTQLNCCFLTHHNQLVMSPGHYLHLHIRHHRRHWHHPRSLEVQLLIMLPMQSAYRAYTFIVHLAWFEHQFCHCRLVYS